VTHRLIRNYLLHYGYADTLAAFDAASGTDAEAESTSRCAGSQLVMMPSSMGRAQQVARLVAFAVLLGRSRVQRMSLAAVGDDSTANPEGFPGLSRGGLTLLGLRLDARPLSTCPCVCMVMRSTLNKV
jgi:hypothetical protein